MRTIRTLAGAMMGGLALAAAAPAVGSTAADGFCYESSTGNFVTCCSTDATGKITDCRSIEVVPLQPVRP